MIKGGIIAKSLRILAEMKRRLWQKSQPDKEVLVLNAVL